MEFRNIENIDDLLTKSDSIKRGTEEEISMFPDVDQLFSEAVNINEKNIRMDYDTDGPYMKATHWQPEEGGNIWGNIWVESSVIFPKEKYKLLMDRYKTLEGFFSESAESENLLEYVSELFVHKLNSRFDLQEKSVDVKVEVVGLEEDETNINIKLKFMASF